MILDEPAFVSFTCKCELFQLLFDSFETLSIRTNMIENERLTCLEPVCCKKQQKKFMTIYWFAE